MLTSDGTCDLALRIHGTHSFGKMTEYLCRCPNLSQTRCHPLPWLSDQLSDPCQPFLMGVRSTWVGAHVVGSRSCHVMRKRLLRLPVVAYAFRVIGGQRCKSAATCTLQ